MSTHGKFSKADLNEPRCGGRIRVLRYKRGHATPSARRMRRNGIAAADRGGLFQLVGKLEAVLDEIPAPAITELVPGFAELFRSQDVPGTSVCQTVQVSDGWTGSPWRGQSIRRSGKRRIWWTIEAGRVRGNNTSISSPRWILCDGDEWIPREREAFRLRRPR